jgi:hypothetical protein
MLAGYLAGKGFREDKARGHIIFTKGKDYVKIRRKGLYMEARLGSVLLMGDIPERFFENLRSRLEA